jgi:hypothetical protein
MSAQERQQRGEEIAETRPHDRTAAGRMRRHRARLKSGDIFVSGDIPALDVEAAINAGWLTDEDSQDPATILQKLLLPVRRLLHRGKL